MSFALRFRWLLHPLMEHRSVLSLGLSIASGIVLQSLFSIRYGDPFLRLLALQRPAIFQGLVWSYNVFLYSTPFLVLSILFSLGYVHLSATERNWVAG